MTYVDLHMHSIYSDGRMTCEALLNEVMEKNIELFSLTDHDTIEGIEEMKTLAAQKNVSFLPGVEVAVSIEGKEYHLTTYGYNSGHKGFLDLLAFNLNQRKNFDVQIIQALEKGYDFTLDDFLKYEDNIHRGGWPSLNFLIDAGLIQNIYEYFKLTQPFNVKLVFKNPDEVIPVLHDAGAKVFLAHPSAYFKEVIDVKLLDYFKSLHIDGIECYSPYLKDEQELTFYIEYCQKNNLKISGGSDYHGGFVNRKMGFPKITKDMVSYEVFHDMMK